MKQAASLTLRYIHSSSPFNGGVSEAAAAGLGRGTDVSLQHSGSRDELKKRSLSTRLKLLATSEAAESSRASVGRALVTL